MDFLVNCLSGSNCSAEVRRAAEAKLDRLPASLDATYALIRAKAPNATVVVLGYHRILPDTIAGCFIDAMLTPRPWSAPRCRRPGARCCST
ncbi:hypothetical protein [Nocardia sp. NPDC050793]|uniref:hypothetical protein n=1 Tax=Nocardia sp. NPDC050793 TaxID=3155159 RepID=UPI0033CE71D4